MSPAIPEVAEMAFAKIAAQLDLLPRNRFLSRGRWLPPFAGEHAINPESQRSAAVQSAPTLRHHDRVSGILRIVLYGSWDSDTAVVQIDELAQMCHVLRGFVLHARNVVMIDEKLSRVRLVGVQLCHVDHRAIYQSADAVKLLTALALVVRVSLLAARGEPQQSKSTKNNGAAGDSVETESGQHDVLKTGDARPNETA